MGFLRFLKNPKIILILILVLATTLRIINLADWPVSFNQDEALNGYEAYSILKTGHDHRGNPWPIFFEGFNDRSDNRLPLYIYTAVPFIALFDLNKFSTRLPSVIFGILTIIAAYFLAKQIFKQQGVALLTCFFVAISPWHIFLSRLGLEVITVPLFFILSVFFIIKGFEEKGKFLLWAGVSLAALFYTYHVAKIFPFILIIFSLLYFRKKIKEKKKWLIIGLLFFIMLSLPFLIIQFGQWSRIQGRFNNITILNYRFIWPIVFIVNILSYFSARFFLLHYPFIVTFFFILGFCLLWLTKERDKGWLILMLILFSLVPPALVIKNPHSHRSMAIIPFIEIIASFGLWQIIEKIKSLKIPLAKIYFSLILIFFIFLFLNINYLIKNDYPYCFLNGFYNYVPKEVVDYVQKNQENYDGVVFTNQMNEPYIFFLFFLKYPPAIVQVPGFIERIHAMNGLVEEVASFGNYKFCNLDKCYSSQQNNLYVARNKELSQFKAKKTFNDIKGNVFKIITND